MVNLAWLKGRETDVTKNRMCAKLKEDAFQEKAGSWDGSSQRLDVFWLGAFESGSSEDNLESEGLLLVWSSCGGARFQCEQRGINQLENFIGRYVRV